jgi:hypothetical protein
MKIAISFTIIALIFGCKDQNKTNVEEIAVPVTKVDSIEKKKNESIFDLIINKKETAEKLVNEFSYDSIISFSKEEKLRYEKIGLNDGYYLTNFRFLKRPIDSIDFSIFYKISFGDQLEKILRVKLKDTIFDMTLALNGGDGGDTWYTRTEFINDSIFIKTSTYKQTAIENPHLMAYATDSIITKYYYDENLNFKEVKKDSFHIFKKYPTFHKNLKGKTFKAFSDIFSINGMKCHWEYEVKYTDETNENSKEYLVNIISQKLMKFSPREYILDLDLSKFPFRTIRNIIDLEYTDYFSFTNDKLKDINFDGYDDFEFQHNVGGANQNYTVYLFNPNLKKFEYSEELSGSSLGEGIELDKKKKIAIYSGKGGYGHYGFRKVHFNLDGSIKYQEKFWNEDLDYYSFRDSINHYKYAFYYLKKKNNITLDSLRLEKEVNDYEHEPIYSPFFEWVDTFDK